MPMEYHGSKREVVVQTGISGVQIVFHPRFPRSVRFRYYDGTSETFHEFPTDCLLVAAPRMMRAAILRLEEIQELNGNAEMAEAIR